MSAPSARDINVAFQRQGLSLQFTALSRIQLHLKTQLKSDPSLLSSTALTSLVTRIKKSINQHSSSSIVDSDTLSSALSSFHTPRHSAPTSLIHHLSALTLPRFAFAHLPEGSRFISLPPSPPLCSPVVHKPLLFLRRFHLIQQRVLNNRFFKGTTPDYPLSSLHGLQGTHSTAHVLALLTQSGDGEYRLEDDTPLSVRVVWGEEFDYSEGFFPEGCVVLCVGRMLDEATFRVDSLALPPAETRADTLLHRPELQPPVSALTPCAEADTIVVMCDVWLDQPAVIARLHAVLQAMESGDMAVPPVLVLAGPFTSAGGGGQGGGLSPLLEVLGDLIAAYPRVNGATEVVLVPAAGDTPFGVALPHPPMLGGGGWGVRGGRRRVMASNPHHLQYHTRRLVFHRHETMALMQRHSLLTPKEIEGKELHVRGGGGGQLTSEQQHYLHTVLSQSHLTPFTLDTVPVYWEYDAALSLYPLPDVLFVLDGGAPLDVTLAGCIFVNPGSLGKNGSFAVYYPHSNKVDESQTPL